jgi:hypothetical protein
MLNRRSIVSVMAVAAALCLGNAAQAAFTYSVTPASGDFTFGPGGSSTLTVAGAFAGVTSPTLAGTQIINLAQITQTSTRVAPPTDTAPDLLNSLTVTISNSGGSKIVGVNGSFEITRSDTLGAASVYHSVNIVPASFDLGGFTYTISNVTYAAPTIGAGANANGSLSAMITETPIPEPATLAVLAIGGMGLLARRRRA